MDESIPIYVSIAIAQRLAAYADSAGVSVQYAAEAIIRHGLEKIDQKEV